MEVPGTSFQRVVPITLPPSKGSTYYAPPFERGSPLPATPFKRTDYLHSCKTVR